MTAGLRERLIRAGFRFDSAIRIINSALLLKSGDESLATADSCEIDLFCGRADFCKAGAAPSYVLKHGHAVRVSAMSLPVGSGGTAFEEEIYARPPGTGCDGLRRATRRGRRLIMKELRHLPKRPRRKRARCLAERAKAVRSDGTSDDITVLGPRRSWKTKNRRQPVSYVKNPEPFLKGVDGMIPHWRLFGKASFSLRVHGWKVRCRSPSCCKCQTVPFILCDRPEDLWPGYRLCAIFAQCFLASFHRFWLPFSA
jgi:hypothetical protein